MEKGEMKKAKVRKQKAKGKKNEAIIEELEKSDDVEVLFIVSL
jgi:hypothetical protein